MKPGDLIWVRVFKSDGSTHRWWQAIVESVSADCLVTYIRAGNEIFLNPERFKKSIHVQKHDIRSYYWPGRRYDMLEVYWPDGRLYELYADITGPIELIDGEVHFVDHELDVQMFAGQEPIIIDQDEFAEAAEQYGYTAEFVRESYALAEELLVVMAGWTPLGIKPVG